VVEDEEVFAAQVHELMGLYETAADLAQEGVHVVSCDEKTGIQALERLAPTRPMKRGVPERLESHYRRHGTICLIANLALATGDIIAPSFGATRTNVDFADHVASTIDTDPDAGWVFVVDNLNTHCSEELVRLVADRCDLNGDLGKKGRSGVLKNRATRSLFLSDSSHRVRFVYTPKHCSWLNQIENWFSRLVRAVLRRGSFSSLQDLEDRLRAYIRFHNRFEAEPMNWTATATSILRKFRIETSGSLH